MPRLATKTEPTTPRPRARLVRGDCLDRMRRIPSGSVAAVICDPPYPEVDRDYGRMTEAAWLEMMRGVVAECRRILRPDGSAVFVLQPNSLRVGSMRLWFYEFVAWAGREWNLVQDAYWWNPATLPTVHCQRTRGLMRPSVKPCVWLGPADCYRDQSAVLWSPSDACLAADRADRALSYSASGAHRRPGRLASAADERGGVTPFNLLPVPNTDSAKSSGALGHGAGTPRKVAGWWVRYLSRPGDLVADPFAGAGTIGEVALELGRSYWGCELTAKYHAVARRRLAAAEARLAAA